MTINNTFSPEQLRDYHNWVGPNLDKATALCTLNIAVSESLYPAISIFELTLRDSINSSLINHFGIDWYRQDLVKFHSKNLRQVVFAEISKLKYNKISEHTLNRQFVTKMNLSYWTNFFDPINLQLWELNGIKSVFLKVEDVNYSVFFKKINQVKLLRNQISHQKTIIQNNLILRYRNCREVIGLMSNDALSWCDYFSRFWEVHPYDLIIENGTLSPKVDLTPWIQIEKSIVK